MNVLLNTLKTLYKTNKKLFIVAIIVIVAFVIIGCSSNAGYSGGQAPSGPIGGGCG